MKKLLEGRKRKLMGEIGNLHGNISADLHGDISGLHGNISGLLHGNISGIYGNISSGLCGNISGIYGDCTDIFGDLDLCELTEEERKQGVKISDLLK